MFNTCSRRLCMDNEEVTTARRVKDGELLRYKTGLFGGKWSNCYMVLMSDSRLLLFNKSTESKTLEHFSLPETIPYMCVGPMTDRLTAKRPSLPPNTDINNLIGIALNENGSEAFWLLFPSDAELQDWLQNIVKMLPLPSSQPSNGQAVNPASSQEQAPCTDSPNVPAAQGGGSHSSPSTELVLGGSLLIGTLAGYGIGSMFNSTVPDPSSSVDPNVTVETSQPPAANPKEQSLPSANPSPPPAEQELVLDLNVEHPIEVVDNTEP